VIIISHTLIDIRKNIGLVNSIIKGAKIKMFFIQMYNKQYDN